MFTIIKRRELNPTVTELCIHAPLIAKKAKAGQFIIVRAKEDSERIPLTIAGFDREAGTVSIIFQVVGAGTMQLNSLKEGEAVHDFVGPLGKATEIEGLKNVGKEPTRERLRAGLASIRSLSFGDFNVGFGNKAPYIGSDAIYLAIYAENGRRIS